MRHSDRGINCEGSESKGDEEEDTIEAESNILDCLQMLRRDWRLF